MRAFSPQACTSSFRSITSTRPIASHFGKVIRPAATSSLRMSSSGAPTTTGLNIENKDVQTAPGISLTSDQQTIVGSVLDLFAGRPSLQKLGLWRDDATFTDPLTIAQGRERYSAQWYGLQSAFSEIERLHHSVKDAGNPIIMDLKTRYVVKGIGKEQTIQSVVAIHLDEQGKIARLEDKWDGKLPDGSISNAFRHLNAATVPKMINVPKNAEEDAKKGN
ncbi:unnamed protein product [Periconia digitata]|uniref:SnoaL-like domain-containing protein n=1 Tax=Periconia digitata TaxID=1303443 RepID=A0A9W4XGF8_9PLEO|nr:unnamed protein product [Periconia digitata]